ncbi:MAG TPA: DUF5919 domain-containing protein [Pseudonocardiaceae bacterium]|jgi:hypothetical protein|nr:DUF5919 domain-containing protein [Pseudonocardiaceae bacterium]
MTTEGTNLKALLRERHLQEHQAFCREYDRVARRIDPALQCSYPSKTTFYRWLSGDLRTLPYPSHCRVLEEMLPGWSAEQLFRARSRDEVPNLVPREEGTGNGVTNASTNAVANPTPFGDLAAVFLSRADFTHRLPPDELLNGANDIRAVGLSLNLLCQHFGDRRLRSLLEAGCRLRCLFLDPQGDAIKAREQEEGYDTGLLSSLTAFNMQILERLRLQLSDDVQSRLQIHVYDEPVRFNITIVDRCTCIAQPYLPVVRGVDSPTFVIERLDDSSPGLFGVFEQVVDALWERSKPVG